jgi:hypothetical protein
VRVGAAQCAIGYIVAKRVVAYIVGARAVASLALSSPSPVIMSPDREENVDDGANDITYPSPTAETMDAGPFYHTGPRDGGAQEHVESVEHHDVHDIHDPDQVKEPEHEHEHEQNDISAMDPPTSQHVSRPTNLEELQLAAQLGQGLAGTPLIPNTDPNMNVEDPNLRSIMPAHENEQHHSPYIHDAQTSEQLLPHGLPEGLPVSVGPALAQHYSLDNGIPPRKRSKVSRACDECRRKKIKCDAQSDTGETPCSSCARSNIRCLFSRIPQKRGPSKG